MNLKYSKDILESIVKQSLSVAEVVRKLNNRESVSGSMQTHISKRLKSLNIDTSHFLGRKIRYGFVSKRKRKASEILVRGKEERAFRLKRALLEIGRDYICEVCGLEPIWNGKPLTLQIDHINGDRINNTKENIRFICANCHTQTETFCSKNITSSSKGRTTGFELVNLGSTPSEVAKN